MPKKWDEEQEELTIEPTEDMLSDEPSDDIAVEGAGDVHDDLVETATDDHRAPFQEINLTIRPKCI